MNSKITVFNINTFLNSFQIQNTNKALGIKVILVIGSQLTCWISIIIVMVFYAIFNNLYAPNLLYELTATIVLPMNSYLNPIFNSTLYRYVFLR